MKFLTKEDVSKHEIKPRHCTSLSFRQEIEAIDDDQVPNIVKYTDIFLKLVFDVVGVGISEDKKIILEDFTKKNKS
jgi:hypothetical protein